MEPNPCSKSQPRNIVKMVTTRLVQTYSMINKQYHSKKRRHGDERLGQAKRQHGPYKSNNNGYDDAQHNLIMRRGDMIMDRYEVIRSLGSGSFGLVVECIDRLTKGRVALKVVKNKRVFHKQVKQEIDILNHLQSQDSTGRNCIVKYKGQFVWKNHRCLKFELLSSNLYDVLAESNFVGLDLMVVRKFAIQMFTALSFMKKNNVVHCDLKPENVLLCSPRRSAIKIVDFGCSCYDGQLLYSYVQSRFYRAPEVILGTPYGHPVDVWSVACILYELHTGQPLVNGTDERDQMGLIVELFGVPAREQLSSKKASNYFQYSPETRTHEFQPSPEGSRTYMPPGSRDLRYLLGVDVGGPSGRRENDDGHSVEDYELFLDLLRKMFVYDPLKRITPEEAIHHPFLQHPCITSERREAALAAASSATTLSTSSSSASLSTASLSLSTSSSVQIGETKPQDDSSAPCQVDQSQTIESNRYMPLSPERTPPRKEHLFDSMGVALATMKHNPLMSQSLFVKLTSQHNLMFGNTKSSIRDMPKQVTA